MEKLECSGSTTGNQEEQLSFNRLYGIRGF